MTELEITVVGMRHHMTPSTLQELERECPLKCRLKREVQNIHDENAIAVVCLEKPWAKMKIGYVPRDVAAEFAPRVDTGRLEFHDVWLTGVDVSSGVGDLKLSLRKVKTPGN
jgi:HIRAN domain